MLWYSVEKKITCVMNFYMLQMNISLCTLLAKTAEGLCSILSPSVVQWDAMTVFMELVAIQIVKSLQGEVTEVILNNRAQLWE